jgi:transposase InsO family protein
VRRRKAKTLGPKPGTSADRGVNQPARFANDVWTYDCVADRTVSGGARKWRTLVDAYTRECLALPVGRTVNGADVRRVLARVVGRRGAPGRLRSDTGSAFIGAALAQRLPAPGTEAIPGAPASPWANGFGASFHSRCRDEFLEVEAFENVADARAKGTWFRREYTTVRPPSSLGYQTPQEFSDSCARRHRGRVPKPNW